MAVTPLLGLAAFSGVGKTTLLEALIPILTGHGLRVAVIKHAHHRFDIDHPGKDSHRLRKAGAGRVVIASDRRLALVVEREPPAEPGLDELIAHADAPDIDLILVEGFRHHPFPKIELHRKGLGHPLLHPEDPSIIAVASDAPLDTPLPLLDINDPEGIAAFILNAFLGEDHARTPEL